MFVNDLFKLTENSNEEYYAVYDQRGKPMVMRPPKGKTAKAYAEEKNYRIKGGPFSSHQETESFWIRSVLPNKKQDVAEGVDDTAYGRHQRYFPKGDVYNSKGKKLGVWNNGLILDPAIEKRWEDENGYEWVDELKRMASDYIAQGRWTIKSEQDIAEAIPYALSAANAAAEYRRQGAAGGGYRGRIDMPVQSREDYLAVGQALTKAARAAGQRIDFGLSDGVMSVFSDTMTADELDEFIDNVLNQGLSEGSESSIQKKIQSKQDSLSLAREQRRAKGQRQQGQREIKLQTEIDRLNTELTQLKKQGVAEGSVQDKLYKRHQELRKKRGAPDPEYYKELKTTFDLPDDERWARTAELKKKYNIKESTVTNEDRERYLDEMRCAGYEIVTESATLCPECGGAAYADRMLAEKQDACYHKVKSRYKVWPSAYASGALVRCRKKGAANWGNKSKK